MTRSRTVDQIEHGAMLRVDQPVDARRRATPRAAPPPPAGRARCRRARPDGRSECHREFSRHPRMRAEQIARRMVLRIADDGDAAAVGAHGLALGNGVDRVVGALAVHVRLQQLAAAASTVGSGKMTT